MLSIVNDMYNQELAKAIKGMQAAIDNNYKYEYDKNKKKIEDYHKKLTGKGVKLPRLELPGWKEPSLREPSSKSPSARRFSRKEPSLSDLTSKPAPKTVAKPLKKSVGEATEMVAGRTGKQIEAAKRAQSKRLGQSGAGGKSKRCKKGKSCGATCINGSKVCLVDIPWASASGIPKAVKAIQSRGAKSTPKPEKMPKPSAEPKVKLSKLETTKDFNKKISDTGGEYSPRIAQIHSALRKLIGPGIGLAVNYDNDKEKGKFEALRAKLFKSLGNGDEGKGGVLAKYAYDALRKYTGSYSKEIREAQMGVTPNDKYLKMGKAIERLINSSEVAKPAVEKFRGKRVDSTSLQGMIESAKMGGTFDGKALASWSTSLSISKDFADQDRFDGRNERVILRTVNTKGAPIKTLSSIDYEYEVLTPGTAKYKYLNYRTIEEGGQTYHVFDVVES